MSFPTYSPSALDWGYLWFLVLLCQIACLETPAPSFATRDMVLVAMIDSRLSELQAFDHITCDRNAYRYPFPHAQIKVPGKFDAIYSSVCAQRFGSCRSLVHWQLANESTWICFQCCNWRFLLSELLNTRLRYASVYSLSYTMLQDAWSIAVLPIPRGCCASRIIPISCHHW